MSCIWKVLKSIINICMNEYKYFEVWWSWEWIPHSLYSCTPIKTHVILVLFVWQMEGNTLLLKENVIILCLLKKNTLISVGFICQVNHSLDPELDMCVIECLGFLTTDTIKPPTALWIKFYFRCMRKGLWNLKVPFTEGSPSNYSCESALEMCGQFFLKWPKL